MALLGLTPEQLTGVIIAAVVFTLFIVTLIIYYRRSVQPLQPYLYLTGLLSTREGQIKTKKELLATTYDSLESIQTAFVKQDGEATTNGSLLKTIDTKLHERFKEAVDEVKELSPKPMKILLQTIMMLEEILVIKLVYKHFSQEDDVTLSKEEVMTLPSGTLDKRTIKNALNAQQYADLARAFNETNYNNIFTSEKLSPEEFEKRLDNHFNEQLQHAKTIVKKPGYKHLQLFLAGIIDMHNINIITKWIDTDEKLTLLEGGTIPQEQLQTITSHEQLNELLKTTKYAQSMASDNGQTAHTIPTSIRRHLTHEAKQQTMMRFQHPIRVISYVLHKQAELINIRMLALGIENKMTREQIEPFMI
ncbi:MAG: V0D/AC39 family V-type ATPase subunit [Nanobdellota archaeon]